MSQSFKTDREIAIEYILPDGKTFVETPPKSLFATIEGNGWDLMSNYFSQSKNNILFELPNKSNFTIEGSLMLNKIASQMPHLEVVDVSFDYIALNMELEAQKKVPIQFNPQLSFEEQFHLKDSITIKPDSVLISGPHSLLDPIQSWSSEALKLENLRADVNPIIALVKPPTEQLNIQPNSIQATITVEQFTEKSLFIPIRIKNAPDSLTVFPDQVMIKCIVGLSKYKNLTSNDFTLGVDLQGIPLHTENNTLPISISKQPDFVRGIKLNNQSVEFFFVKSIVSDSLSTEIDPTVIE